MDIFKLLIGVIWIIWICYWQISALGAKRSIRTSNWKKESSIRIAIIVVVILFLRVPQLNQYILAVRFLNASPIITIFGFIVFIFGIALSIWARVCLGRNWGMPQTLREKPELVTNGPYSKIRHPIYTGMIIAMLGTSISINILWLIPFIILSVYFLYSLKIEEKDMEHQFPKEYKLYKKRTNALIPYFY